MKTLLTTALLAILCIAGPIGTVHADDHSPVVIASTNFPEQLILANIYSQVLKSRGIAVKTRLNLGSREVVFPALESGEIDVLPEYSGALLAFLSNGKSKAKTQDEVMTALRDKLPDGVVALDPSSAQDKDGLVVTAETAKKYDLKKVSDLKPVAGDLTLGGPPETKTRYAGVPGLKDVYGIQFGSFRSLDAGGPLTQGALEQGAVDVARMFTTQGVIAAKGWVLLADDKGLVPAQNLVPVARKAVLNDQIRQALNAISKALTTEQLQKMNKRVTVDKADPATVAGDWVKSHDL